MLVLPSATSVSESTLDAPTAAESAAPARLPAPETVPWTLRGFIRRRPWWTVGAIVLVGEHKSRLSTILGAIAVVAATSNVVGGFIITDRMLKMFKSSRPTKP